MTDDAWFIVLFAVCVVGHNKIFLEYGPSRP